jgi:hypothetical protein
MKRVGRIALMTAGIVALSLIPGTVTSRQVRAAVAALVQVSNPVSAPVFTQEVGDKNAFSASVTLNALGSQAIAIPAGQRLVVDFVEIHGLATSLSGPVQPDVLFYTTLNGAPSVNYYLEPGPSPVNTNEGQVSLMKDVKLYADTLTIGTGFAGYSPNEFIMVVSISGHLVPMP